MQLYNQPDPVELADLAQRRPIILAGGLNPANMAQAIDDRQNPSPWTLAAACRMNQVEKIMARSETLSPAPRAWHDQPDDGGHFNPYGGRYVPETLMPALEKLAQAFVHGPRERRFPVRAGGAPDPLRRPRPRRSTEDIRLSEQLGGARIFLKCEDLIHIGAHKINNALGQVILAKKMCKRRIIAETGAGQHAAATATAALMGLECAVYMGTLDIERQALNVTRMRMLGATVEPVTSGSRSLKDAVNQAIRNWVTNVHTTIIHHGLGHGTRLPGCHRPRGP